MATYSRAKSWVSNEVLTAADLNAEFNNILSNANPSGVEDASENVSAMQAAADPGGVGTESLATNLLGEIQRLRFAIRRIVGGAQWYSTPVTTLGAGGISTSSLADGAVTTAKIADANVTSAKLASGAAVANIGTGGISTSLLANNAVTGSKIAGGTIIASNIALNAIGRDQLANVGQIISASSGTFTVGVGGLQDVTNLTVLISTFGRPVILSVIPDYNAGAASQITGVNDEYRLLRGSTILSRGSLSNGALPFYFIDTPAAGSYIYKIQVVGTVGARTWYYKLVAYEL
jgi:hypothetical protein